MDKREKVCSICLETFSKILFTMQDVLSEEENITIGAAFYATGIINTSNLNFFTRICSDCKKDLVTTYKLIQKATRSNEFFMQKLELLDNKTNCRLKIKTESTSDEHFWIKNEIHSIPDQEDYLKNKTHCGVKIETEPISEKDYLDNEGNFWIINEFEATPTEETTNFEIKIETETIEDSGHSSNNNVHMEFEQVCDFFPEEEKCADNNKDDFLSKSESDPISDEVVFKTSIKDNEKDESAPEDYDMGNGTLATNEECNGYFAIISSTGTKFNCARFKSRLDTLVKSYGIYPEGYGKERLAAKTQAQRQKEYRERQKLAKQAQLGAKKEPKTNAQRQKECREKKKIIKRTEEMELARKKFSAERSKRYRARLKLKRQRAELNSFLLPSKEDSTPSDFIEVKTENVNPFKDISQNERIFSGFLEQAKQFQSSRTTEDRQNTYCNDFQSFQAPYEERNECAMPLASLHHDTNIEGDGNCLFSSLIRILNLPITPAVLRQQLLESHYVYDCQNPISAKRILSSETEYGDVDCLFVFSRTYNHNICVHFHYFHNTAKTEIVRFCCFKVNNSTNFLHLHLRDTHFTPYILVEGKPKKKRKIQDNDDDVINMPIYTDYYKHTDAHLEFYSRFKNNTFGHACAVCDRLWYQNELKTYSNVNNRLLEKLIPDYHQSSSNIKVCLSCKASLNRGKIPKMSTYNGFKYPIIPTELPALNLIERQLISPIIAFMQIRRLRHVDDDDSEIYGEVINAAVKVDSMVKKLPRSLEDDYSIYVHIRRKLIHTTASQLLHGLINKNNIKKWLKYLVKTPLYVHHKINVDNVFLNDDDDAPAAHSQLMIDDEVSERVPIEDSLTALQQTILWNEEMFLPTAASSGVQNRGHNVLCDKYSEELSFPTIYGGEFRNYRNDIVVTPFLQVSSELRRSDRRGVDPQHLLYMAKMMRIRVTQSIAYAAKNFGSSFTITKEQIQSENFINNCLQSNLAFLRSIPNSAWYWAERREDVFAMIRQLGTPTAFMTLTANETGWHNLLKILYKLKNKQIKDVSDEFISNMSYMQKAKLVNEDAVTCAIYFNKLVNCLLRILQYVRKSPFGKYRVTHYFRRIEFQERGNTRAHILLWLDNVPKNLLNNDVDVTQMIDELVSVSETESSGNIELQRHKHSSACSAAKQLNANEKDVVNCRFGAPFLPSRCTITLLPMEATDPGVSKQVFKAYKKHYELIRANLEKCQYKDFNHFYTHNHIASDEHYYKIIRAGIDCPQFLYRRNPTEIWNNAFNPFLLHHLKATMNFQIIPDEHACAAYVNNYINKQKGEISNLQRQIIQIMNENPEIDIGDMTKKIRLDLLNCVEMSVQESAWFLLREPMVKSSAAIVYIPTVNPEERQKKNFNELHELDDGDDDYMDIWKENCFFDEYVDRPENLNKVTLAQFVAKYYLNKKGIYAVRSIPKIIRYRNYDMLANFDDFRREMVLLHIPFRNEDYDILVDKKFIEIYENNKDLIDNRRKEFESNLGAQKVIEIECKNLSKENDEKE